MLSVILLILIYQQMILLIHFVKIKTLLFLQIPELQHIHFFINATTISSNTTTNTLNLRSGATRNLAASPPIIQNGDNVTVQIKIILVV